MAVDYNPVTNALGEQKKGFETFKGERESTINNLKDELGYRSRIRNIDSTRKALMDTESILNRLPKDIQRRTAGRLMTQSQLNRLQAKEATPLADSVGNLARSLDVAERGLSDTRAAIADENANLFNLYDRNANVLGAGRETAFNKYLSDVGGDQFTRNLDFQGSESEKQRQLQRDLAAQQIAAQREAAARQVAAQREIAMIQDRLMRDQMAKQEAQQQQAYQQYVNEANQGRKDLIQQDIMNTVVVDPTTVRWHDQITGQANERRERQAQEIAASEATKKALQSIYDDYDKGLEYFQSIVDAPGSSIYDNIDLKRYF